MANGALWGVAFLANEPLVCTCSVDGWLLRSRFVFYFESPKKETKLPSHDDFWSAQNMFFLDTISFGFDLKLTQALYGSWTSRLNVVPLPLDLTQSIQCSACWQLEVWRAHTRGANKVARELGAEKSCFFLKKKQTPVNILKQTIFNNKIYTSWLRNNILPTETSKQSILARWGHHLRGTQLGDLLWRWWQGATARPARATSWSAVGLGSAPRSPDLPNIGWNMLQQKNWSFLFFFHFFAINYHGWNTQYLSSFWKHLSNYVHIHDILVTWAFVTTLPRLGRFAFDLRGCWDQRHHQLPIATRVVGPGGWRSIPLALRQASLVTLCWAPGHWFSDVLLHLQALHWFTPSFFDEIYGFQRKHVPLTKPTMSSVEAEDGHQKLRTFGCLPAWRHLAGPGEFWNGRSWYF